VTETQITHVKVRGPDLLHRQITGYALPHGGGTNLGGAAVFNQGQSWARFRLCVQALLPAARVSARKCKNLGPEAETRVRVQLRVSDSFDYDPASVAPVFV
jgi:hypothetical protein